MTPWGVEGDVDSQALFGRTILQVVPALDAGAEACVDLAASLSEAGGRALSPGRRANCRANCRRAAAFSCPSRRSSRKPWRAFLSRRRLASLALREGVELIHVHAGASMRAALHAARKARVPLVADYEPAQQFIALRWDSIIFFSRAEFEDAISRRPELAAKAFRGLRGVDLRQFSPEAVDWSRVRRFRDALGVKGHERLVIAVGLPPERRQMVLAAAAQLKAKGFFASEAQQARFVWLRRDGEAPSTAFDAEAARLGLAGAVLQIDWPDRAAACLAAALVVAPAGELALCVEAQALGAPLAVLQTSGAKGSGVKAEVEEVCAPPQVEPSMRTGWLISPGPPASLVRAVEEAVRLGATARENLAHNARAHARNFSAERMNALTLAIYARHFGASE